MVCVPHILATAPQASVRGANDHQRELYITCRTVCKTTDCFITGIPKQQGEFKMPAFTEHLETVCAALWAAAFLPS